jgi:fucose permease
MQWLHAAYSTGAALGATLMAAVVALRAGWRIGYVTVAVPIALLATAFLLTHSRWSSVSTPHGAAETRAEMPMGAGSAWRLGRVRLGVAMFFVYSGIEFGVAHWAYTLLTEARGVSLDGAAQAVTVYWASLLAGRVASGLVVERIASLTLVRLGMALAVVGAALLAVPLLPAAASTVGLALIGVAIAPIYPGMMSETPRRVGAEASAHAVGFQVSGATAGMVALPALGGWLAERFGVNATGALVLGCAITLLLLERNQSRGN